MPYKKWDFENPVEKDMSLVAVYDCSPDWGSITYNDGGESKTYEFKDETDFRQLYGTSTSTAADFKFYDVTVPRANVTGISIGKNVKNIDNYFAIRCSNLVNLEFPVEINTIGNYFLYYNTSFNQELNLPNGLKTIGASFMAYCTGFNSPVNFNDELEAIGSSFLYNCSSFNSAINFNYRLRTIDSSFLGGCTKFDQEIIVHNDLMSLGTAFLTGCSSFNSRINVTEHLQTFVPNSFLANCTKFNQSIVLRDTITSIGDNFISSGITSSSVFNQPLTLPLGLLSIGKEFLCGTAFNQPIDLPDSIKTIGGYFLSCTNFNQPLTLPSGITSIENSFLATSDFNHPLTIPEGVISIGTNFLGQTWVRNSSMHFNQPIKFPSTLKTIGTFFLEYQSDFNQPLDFPEGLEKVEFQGFLRNGYKFNQPLDLSKFSTVNSQGLVDFAANWYSYDQDIVLPSTLTKICLLYSSGYGNFTNMTHMTHNIVIPSSVTEYTANYNSGTAAFLISLSATSSSAGQGFKGTIIFDTEADPAPVSSQAKFAFAYEASWKDIYCTYKIAGSGAEKVKAAYPDSDTASPYRKLVIVDDPRKK